MLKITIFSITFLLSTLVLAGVPNNFEAGQPIVASDVNENFTSIDNRIENLESNLKSSIDFLGFSSSTIDASSGYFGLQAACRGTYIGSKVCTSSELINATYNPGANNMSDTAWIIPSISAAANSGTSATSYIMVDGLGRVNSHAEYLACDGFRRKTNQYSGLTVDNLGRLEIQSCDILRKVACCK